MITERRICGTAGVNIMASYKDYLNGKINVTAENLSKAVSSMAAAANKRLKRIEQQGWTYAKADSTESKEKTTIAGHEKFGAKGKTIQQLKTEFKRLQDFFKSGVSSVSEVRKQAKAYKVRESELRDYIQMKEKQEKPKDPDQYVRYKKTWSKKDKERFEQAKRAEETRSKRRGVDTTYKEGWDTPEDWYQNWIEGLRFYNRLVEEKIYKPMIGESDTARWIAETVAAESRYDSDMTFDDMVARFNELMNEHTTKKWEERVKDKAYYSTSDFFYGRNK